jgi:hypothetical protein
MNPPRDPRGPAPAFRPVFTLMLVYFFVLFLFFALLLTVPAQLEALHALPPDASDDEAIQALAQVSQRAVAGRLWLALLATCVTLAIGAYARVLPGIKRPR